MSRTPLLALIAATLLCAAAQASAQQAQPDFPDGPGKQTFVNLCGACHDINRVRLGYTPEGWHTVMRMMLNFGVPVPKDEVDTLTQYLIKNFPERPRPSAVVIPGPVEATIKLWPVPTPGSRPHNRAALMAMDAKTFIASMERWRAQFAKGAELPVIGASEKDLNSIKVPTCIIPGNDKTHNHAIAETAHRMIAGSELYDLFPGDLDVDLVPPEDWAPKEAEMAAVFVDFLRRAQAKAA